MSRKFKNSLVVGLLLCLLACQSGYANERDVWLKQMDKVAGPVLQNLAATTLKKNMQVEVPPHSDNATTRKQFAHLEAFARTMSGISPWLATEGGSQYEQSLRKQYRLWSQQAIKNAVNPESADYLLWQGYQPLVDASFLALALLRSPWLWEALDAETQQQLVTAINASQDIVQVYSNWLLFPAMIEAFNCRYTKQCDKLRIEFAVREFSQHWYVGDGLFTDGEHFAMDYYNSYVIHPYLSNIVDALGRDSGPYAWYWPELQKINGRYAEIQERSINSDGSYPLYGRSVVYRSGAFHHLADMALRKQLPESLKAGQVRAALSAVIKKSLGATGTFNKKGWLTLGVSGEQMELADHYNNTGSLYLCSTIFLPLGLPPDDSFWTSKAEAWSSVKFWNN